MFESFNMLMDVKQICDMEEGSVMICETKVLHSLKGICYTLFVTTHQKAMIKTLSDYGGEQNLIVWVVKKYPSSKDIQLYGTWLIINAMYWSKLAEQIVADLECI